MSDDEQAESLRRIGGGQIDSLIFLRSYLSPMQIGGVELTEGTAWCTLAGLVIASGLAIMANFWDLAFNQDQYGPLLLGIILLLGGMGWMDRIPSRPVDQKIGYLPFIVVVGLILLTGM